MKIFSFSGDLPRPSHASICDIHISGNEVTDGMLLLLTLSLALLNPIKIGLNHVQIVIRLHLRLLAGDGGWRLAGLPLKG